MASYLPRILAVGGKTGALCPEWETRPVWNLRFLPGQGKSVNLVVICHVVEN